MGFEGVQGPKMAILSPPVSFEPYVIVIDHVQTCKWFWKTFEKFLLNLENIFETEQIFALKPQKCQFWATWGSDWEIF